MITVPSNLYDVVHDLLTSNHFRFRSVSSPYASFSFRSSDLEAAAVALIVSKHGEAILTQLVEGEYA